MHPSGVSTLAQVNGFTPILLRVAWPVDLLRGATLVRVEWDWTAATARLVFEPGAKAADEPRAIAAVGVRRAVFGGVTASLPSSLVVKVWEPHPTNDGLLSMEVEMDDKAEFLVIDERFEIVP